MEAFAPCATARAGRGQAGCPRGTAPEAGHDPPRSRCSTSASADTLRRPPDRQCRRGPIRTRKYIFEAPGPISAHATSSVSPCASSEMHESCSAEGPSPLSSMPSTSQGRPWISTKSPISGGWFCNVRTRSGEGDRLFPSQGFHAVNLRMRWPRHADLRSRGRQSTPVRGHPCGLIARPLLSRARTSPRPRCAGRSRVRPPRRPDTSQNAHWPGVLRYTFESIMVVDAVPTL